MSDDKKGKVNKCSRKKRAHSSKFKSGRFFSHEMNLQGKDKQRMEMKRTRERKTGNREKIGEQKDSFLLL